MISFAKWSNKLKKGKHVQSWLVSETSCDAPCIYSSQPVVQIGSNRFQLEPAGYDDLLQPVYPQPVVKGHLMSSSDICVSFISHLVAMFGKYLLCGVAQENQHSLNFERRTCTWRVVLYDRDCRIKRTRKYEGTLWDECCVPIIGPNAAR